MVLKGLNRPEANAKSVLKLYEQEASKKIFPSFLGKRVSLILLRSDRVTMQ